MPLSEADTRAKLMDPELYRCGWTEEHIKREETAVTILVINGKGKRRKDFRLENFTRANHGNRKNARHTKIV